MTIALIDYWGRVLSLIYLAVLQCSVGEWWMHKDFMHGKWLLDLEKRYAHIHPFARLHLTRAFPNSQLAANIEKRSLLQGISLPYIRHGSELGHHGEIEDDGYRQHPGLITFMFGSKSAMPWIWGAWALCWYLIGSRHPELRICAWVYTIVGCIYVGVYERVHWEFHYGETQWLRRLEFFKKRDADHVVHHDKFGRGLNVVLPFGDALFGTQDAAKNGLRVRLKWIVLIIAATALAFYETHLQPIGTLYMLIGVTLLQTITPIRRMVRRMKYSRKKAWHPRRNR